MDFRFRNLLIGFLVAAVAVVCVHQVIVLLLNTAGIWAAKPWSTAPVAPFGVPTIVNQMFWGGLWGVALAVFYNLIPTSAAVTKGLLFGWFIFLAANCIVVPLIKGLPLFFGFDPMKLLSVFLILSGFGMATALLYRAFRTA